MPFLNKIKDQKLNYIDIDPTGNWSYLESTDSEEQNTLPEELATVFTPV